MSTEEEKTTSEVDIEDYTVKCFKFGNSELSDVIFEVDGTEFHCHKMLLAAKCEYFASMFASGFKEKEQERIKIDADKVAFERLMDIIYTGYFEDSKELMVCNSFETLGIGNEQLNKNLWKAAMDLFDLADRFLLTDVVRNSFHLLLIRYDRECPYKKEIHCVHCAVKLLLALCFGMDDYKKMWVPSKFAVKEALKRLPGDLPISTEAMLFLLEII